MKNHLLKTALFAAAGLALIAPHVKAQEAYTPDDLLLSVRETGQTFDYVINLGLASQFETGGAFAGSTAASPANLGNYAADLTDIFGASWTTSSTVSWSIVGTSGNVEVSSGTTAQGEYVNTLFSSNAETAPGTQTSGPVHARASNGTQGTPASKITSFGGSLSNSSSTDGAYTLTGPGAVFQSGTVTNNYLTFSNGGTPFSYFTSSAGKNLEDTFAQGIGSSGATLDLYRSTATTAVDSNGLVVPPAGQTYMGSFDFSNSGELQFEAVPEPSTYAFMGVGSLLLMVWFRRRSRRAILA